MEENAMKATADQAMEAVRAESKEAAVSVHVDSSRATNIRFARGTIQSCGDVTEPSVSIRVMLGKRHAEVNSNQTEPARLQALAKRVVEMAKLAPEDPESMPLLPAQTYLTATSAYDQAMADGTADARAAVARIAMQATAAAELDEAGFLETGAHTSLLANSAGLTATHRGTYGEFTLTARTRDAAGSGWAIRASHLASGIDAASVTKAACDKAVRSAHAKPLDPGLYTVVLEPAAVGELLAFLGRSISARSIDEGRSALTKPGGGSYLGEKIVSDLITLRSDPMSTTLPGAPFDHEGLPCKPIHWIDRGVLSAVNYSRYWAEKKGKEPTASHGWELLGGDAASIDELVAGVKRGLLVTRFFYTRWLDQQLGLVTGLTRDGVLLIENGRIVGPVSNFRWNHSALAMLKHCDALTKETWRIDRGARVPAIRTHEFNMASLSEAV